MAAGQVGFQVTRELCRKNEKRSRIELFRNYEFHRVDTAKSFLKEFFAGL